MSQDARKHSIMFDLRLVLLIRTFPSTLFEVPDHCKSGLEHRREFWGTYTRRSSRDNAWRKNLILSSPCVKGNCLGMNPTELTVSLSQMSFRQPHKSTAGTYQTPINSIFTSWEKAFLNAALCSLPFLLSRLYIWYAKGTCWWLERGIMPTLWTLQI